MATSKTVRLACWRACACSNVLAGPPSGQRIYPSSWVSRSPAKDQDAGY